MATEINCSCEITENEVTICYPPISSGGGGGITGVAPVGNVPKVATVDTGDVILTLEESSIDDLAAGLSVIKSAAGGQYVTLVANNTDDDIGVQLDLISNNTTTAYRANLFIADPNTASTIGLTQELDFIKLGFNVGGTDTVSLKMESGGGGISARDLTNAASFDVGADTANMQAGAAGSSPTTRLQANLSDILVKSPNISDGTYAYFETDGAGNFTMRSAAPPSGGISSLNALTGATQTFEDDTNVTIVSTGTTHTLTWSGTLADGRIASASTWNAKESALTFSTGLTRATNTITNNLSTGVSGGQTLIGGTAAGDKLVIEVTSNATHTAARDLITLRKNSAAAASTSILMTIGDGQGLNNDELSIYTGNNSGTSGYLLRAGTAFAYFNASSSLRLQIAAADIIQLSSSTAIMVQGITISDAKNIVLNTTTGTKIGTATSQKLAFWNKTPIVQPTTGITGAAFVSGGAGSNIKTDDTFGGYTLQQLAAIIINTGLAA